MIIIYSSKKDISAQKAVLELRSRGTDFMLVDPSESMFAAKLEHRLGGSTKKSKFTLSLENKGVDFDDISVIYVRHLGKFQILERKDDPSLNGWVNRETKNYFWETLEMVDCEWFPAKPTHIYSLEDQKLKELYVAQELGLSIPDTLVTTNPQNALDFYRNHHGRVISKRYSRSTIYFQGKEFGAPTSPVSIRDIGFINNVKYAPTLFQEYIPKHKELRVTVVGNKTIAAEIDSQKTHRTRYDWRKYDLKQKPYKQHMLPKSINDQLVLLAKHLKLNYATYDLILLPSFRPDISSFSIHKP